MVDYTITFIQDVYSIKNIGDNSLDLTLSTLNKCSTSTAVITTIEIPAGETYILPLKNDATYQIDLKDIDDLDESSFLINYYLNLQLSMLQDIYSVLCTCECGCKDCVDKTTKHLELILNTVARTNMYLLLSSPRYDGFIQASNKSAVCYTTPALYCGVEEEWVSGQPSYNEKLIKQLLSLNYLGMYYQELSGLTEQEDIDYINTKFMSTSILCCINKLGVDINKVKQDIDSTMGIMTINVGAYVNQPPVTEDNTLSTDNRTPLTILLTDFPYTDPESTPIQAVRIDTILAGAPIGTLTWDGVDVTPGQVLPAVDFATKDLLFTPPNQDASDTDVFTFSVQDAYGLWSTN